MTRDLETSWAESEQKAREALQTNGAYTDERVPALNGNPVTTDVRYKRVIENYRAYGCADPSETPNSQKTDLNLSHEVDVDWAGIPSSIVEGQQSADDFEPASEPQDQSDVRVVGPVYDPYEKPSAATWQGQYFTGTLGLRMAQAKKVPNLLTFADGQSNFGPFVREQTTHLHRLALDAASLCACQESERAKTAKFKRKIIRETHA